MTQTVKKPNKLKKTEKRHFSTRSKSECVSGQNKSAIIIGAGPAGLTAAFELQKHTKIKPLIFEQTEHIGGISKTLDYKGNKIDIGGHRFFSKSEKVMGWWQNILPIHMPKNQKNDRVEISYRNSKTNVELVNKTGKKISKAFLVRNRLSRIFYKQKFYSYPISLSLKTFLQLGVIKSIRILFSYLAVRVYPKKEDSLENFYINRFGYELYSTFFKNYSERLWGVSPAEISPEWGAQRIKGISISKIILSGIKNLVKFNADPSISQKDTETSWIQKFLYPTYGPGQLWEEVAKKVRANGGELQFNKKVIKLNIKKNIVQSAVIKDIKTGKEKVITGNYYFSTAPVKELVNGLNPKPPKNILAIANGLYYRDFMTVGVLLKKLKVKNETQIPTINNMVPDNWIYIHHPNVNVLRIQFFNNWSPFMVLDRKKVWLGMEFTMDETSKFWKMSNEQISEMAVSELEKLGVAEKNNVLDTFVVKMPNVYPSYTGTYKDFSKVRNYLDKVQNLYLIGRNGMHKYNNQDHSMLTAMEAVNNIKNGIKNKNNIWNVNIEQKYHEGNK